MKLFQTFAPALVALCLTTSLYAAPDAYFGVYLSEEDDSRSGALIEEVAPDSPAKRARLRKGDRIKNCNGTATPHSAALIPILVDASPGDELTLRVNRDGWEKTIRVTLETRPGATRVEPRKPAVVKRVPLPREERGFAGFYLLQRSDQPTVQRVHPDSPASKGDLQANDIILACGGIRTPDRESLIEALSGYRPGETVRMKVRRSGSQRTLSIMLGRRPTQAKAPEPRVKPTKPTPTAKPTQKKRAYIGVALDDNEGNGPLKVDDVRANSPAERFGLRKGDVIKKVVQTASKRQTKVNTIEDFIRAIDGVFAGDRVVFTIKRDGWSSEVSMTLGTAPK